MRETPYGRAEVSWRRGADGFSLAVTVPTGVTATVCLPGQAPRTVESGRHHWHIPPLALENIVPRSGNHVPGL
ncbi:alpha-L-rhamnosidase C-terminal domain-containing protein [Streptomyces mayteni]